MHKTIPNQARLFDRRESHDHAEGAMTRRIEYEVARLPSDVWLGAAVTSIGLALYLKLNGRRDDSLFVGQWAAPLMLVGVYLKLVKIGGSDRVQRNS